MMGLITDPIKSLLFLQELGLDVSEKCKNQLKDMGYELPKELIYGTVDNVATVESGEK